MNKRILASCFYLLLLSVVSCADDTGSTVETRDDSSKVTAAPGGRSPELTPAELADDTVFADGSRPVSWANAGFTDPVKLKKFIRQLQIWVDENQVDSIGAHLDYPLKNPAIKDAKEFKLNYSTYFSDGVKAALADQRLNQVFRNQQGAMIGLGYIWFTEKNNEILIFAINN